LQSAGAKIRAFDPAGRAEAEKLLTNVEFTSGPYLCAEGADALVIITEWNEFRALDTNRLKEIMNGDVVVDLRNIYSLDDMRDRGFNYVGVGRPK